MSDNVRECQRITRDFERGCNLSTSWNTYSDQTAPKADCSSYVYVLDHILKKCITNWAGVCCNFFVKDVAIIYDNHINVQEILCEILTHTFVKLWQFRVEVELLIRYYNIVKKVKIANRDRNNIWVEDCPLFLVLRIWTRWMSPTKNFETTWRDHSFPASPSSSL